MPSLTLAEIQTFVKAEAGISLTAAHTAQSDAVLTHRINMAQRELAMEFTFPETHLEQDLAMVAGTASYAFPSKLGLSETAEVTCDFGSEWVPVRYSIGLVEQSIYTPTQSSWPVEKWEVRISPTDATTTLTVWPTPSQAGTLRFSGYKAIVDMTSGTDASTLDGTLIALRVAGYILARQRAQDADLMLSRAAARAGYLMTRQTATQAPIPLGRRRGVQLRSRLDFLPASS